MNKQIKTTEEKFNIEEELDNQFPKGDKARGKALILIALHKIILEEQARKIFDEIEKIENTYEILRNEGKQIPTHYQQFEDIKIMIKNKFLKTGGEMNEK